MDEVGFMVTQFTKNGMLKVQALGGWWNQVLLAQRVQVMTDEGTVIGVIGSIPPHNLTPEQRAKPMEIKNMLIDIGADDEDDAKAIGIKPGQPILPVTPFTPMSNEKKILEIGRASCRERVKDSVVGGVLDKRVIIGITICRRD